MNTENNTQIYNPRKPLVRLSQCMIVKNEEKNIERALTWGKDIVFEQIVVDTGSTDRTVELAEKLGARIYHFEWIEDFAAAKNFAIEQAAGNWIAFLDADEYMSPEDVKVLMTGLNQIMRSPALMETHLALNCPQINLSDNGVPFDISDRERVFRNLPEIRYTGRIHEILTLSADNIACTDDFRVYHTGYSNKAYNETDKIERNIRMLRRELEEKPDDMDIKDFLADALFASKTEKNIEEAINLYREVMYTTGEVNYYHRKNAYMQYIKILMNLPDSFAECQRICEEAMEKFPGETDFERMQTKE